MKRAPTDPQTGSHIARYRARPLRWGEFLRLAGLGAAAVLGPLLYGMELYSQNLPRYGAVAANLWSQPWLWLSLAALVVFLLLGIVRLAASRRWVDLYQKGLRIKPGKPAFLPWSQVAGVSTEISGARKLSGGERLRYRAALHPTTGRPIHLDEGLENLPELLSQIKAHLYPRLLPALKEEFHTGRWVHFGELAISSQGLRLGADQRNWLDITWPEIKGVQVQNGRLTIEYGQPAAKGAVQAGANHTSLRQRWFEAGRIPNIELLLQLIQQEVTL